MKTLPPSKLKSFTVGTDYRCYEYRAYTEFHALQIYLFFIGTWDISNVLIHENKSYTL